MMARELSGLPLEVVGSVLAPFCRPRDLAQLLAASRGLRSLRRGCVTSLTEKLFEGKPGASNAVPWIRRHHGTRTGTGPDGLGAGVLDDVGLLDWLYGKRDVAATGAYRASLGEGHTVVVTPGGRALAAGSGRHGVLGASGNMNRFLFTEVDLSWQRFPGRIPVSAVACGFRHTLILTAVGTVHSCGLGEYGRLGHGNEDSLSRPTLVESLIGERITQVAAGQAHSVAVSWDGAAFTWGWGFHHVLGHGDELDRLEPTRLPIPPDLLLLEPGASASGRGGGRGSGSWSGSGSGRGPGVTEAGVGAGYSGYGGGYGGGGGGGGGGAEVVDGKGGGGGAGVAARGARDRVTCATAGRRCTVLGTRRGRVLATGGIASGSTTGDSSGLLVFESARPAEFGRVADGGGGGACWRVQCARTFRWGETVETILVIDSLGKAHELYATTCAASPSPWGPLPHVRKQNWTIFSTESSPPPPRRLRVVAPPPTRCSSVLVSRAAVAEKGGGCFSWAEHGAPGRGIVEAYVAVASDGGLHCSALTQDTVVELERTGGVGAGAGAGAAHDGVVHASTSWAANSSSDGTGVHGLLLADGGASVLTHGDGRRGHLGHGTPGYVHTPKAVTTAVVLGSAVRGRHRHRGARSASIQVSTAGAAATAAAAAAGGGAAAVAAALETGVGGGPAARSGRRGGGGGEGLGLLELVDAAADARDLEDDRALAEEGREAAEGETKPGVKRLCV